MSAPAYEPDPLDDGLGPWWDALGCLLAAAAHVGVGLATVGAGYAAYRLIGGVL